MKIGGEILRRALGMLSSPGEVNGSSELMTRESSWREKGVSREEAERAGEGGSREKMGGGREERRSEM